MTDINQTILQKASGDHRLKSDEQAYYLGTFKERVILTVELKDANQELVSSHFDIILSQLREQHPDLTVKISARLDDRWTMAYLKTAQNMGLTASLVEDGTKTSPFGLVLHSHSPVSVKHTDIFTIFPNLAPTTPPTDQAGTTKKPFWQKWFEG